MADPLPNIRLSSGDSQHLDSYSTNHLDDDSWTTRDTKFRTKGPIEGAYIRQARDMAHPLNEADATGTAGSASPARLTPNGKHLANKLIRNVPKDAAPSTAQRLDARKDKESQHIDPLSQHIIHRTITPNMSQNEEQRLWGSVLPQDAAISELNASVRTSSEPTVSRADTSASGLKDKK
ncbi:MAG: hypothetical protein Q9168_006907 [Polycauliona sp. 1 TL-2023]